MEAPNGNGVLEQFRIDFLEFWARLPNKEVFLVLLAAWLALFHLLGNATLGYVDTTSLFEWMYTAYKGHTMGLAASEDAAGLFIPFVVVGLLWFKRHDLLRAEPRLWWPSLLILAVGLLLHVVGYVVQQPRVSIMGLFTGLYAMMGLAWGPGWLKSSLLPFSLLAFCVPLGSLAEPITFPLRKFVSQLVEVISHYILAIDVIRDGTMLKDPQGQYTYEVAAACSGVKSLIVTVALAMLLCVLSMRKAWKWAAMLGGAVVLAVVGNTVRMLTIVVAADFWGPSAGAAAHDNGYISIIPYIPAFIGLLLLERWLADPEPSHRGPENGVPIREGKE